MVLGEPIKGIFTHGWRFVVSDANRISQRVQEENPDARLAAQPESGQLGVVEWFRREFMGPSKDVDDTFQAPVSAEGGCWYLSLRIRDENGEPYTGEPTKRVIDVMQQADKNKKPDHKFRVAEFIREVEAISEAARLKWEEETAESLVEPMEFEQRKLMKARGQKAPVIYVPKGLAAP